MNDLASASMRGRLWLEPGGLVCGYAFDEADVTARLAVEILADGEPIALLRAEEGLAVEMPGLDGDGCHGFTLRLDEAVIAQTRRIVARLANRDAVVGALDLTAAAPLSASPPPAAGVVVWHSGTRLTGHVRRERAGEPVPTVRASIDGREVARSPCRGWVELDDGSVARRVDLDLPDWFADGRAREVEVATGDGVALDGSPCLMVAFPDPLADRIDRWADLASERPRARFADGLLPRTLPFSAIEGWLERFRLPEIGADADRRVAVAVVGTEGRDATLASLESQVGAICRVSCLPPVGSRVGFDARRLHDFLLGDASDCPLVVMAVAGARFAPDAIARFAEAAAQHPSAEAVYPDLLVEADDGRRWPLAFPDFDPELFLETGYCGLVYAVRRAQLLLRPVAVPTLFGCFPGSARAADDALPVHLPFPLATVPSLPPSELLGALAAAGRARLAADGESAAIDVPPDEGARSVRVRRSAPRVALSAIVALRDRPAAVARTLEALVRDLERGRDEILLVDNESTDPPTLDLLAAAAADGHRVLRVPGWFAPARLLSLGADAARGDHLLFVEAGVAGAGDWLDEMRGRLAGYGVAAVGALVSSESGVVRDAGYALGPRCALVARFIDRSSDDPGYAGLLGAAHGCSALSAACLLTSRELFRSLGGFDAGVFPRHLFAPDYCLRAAAAGLRAVFTPRARLTMHGAPPPRADEAARAREARMLFERWALVPGCDPSYPPWMAMDGLPYSGLAWPPAPYRPRPRERRPPRPFPFTL